MYLVLGSTPGNYWWCSIRSRKLHLTLTLTSEIWPIFGRHAKQNKKKLSLYFTVWREEINWSNGEVRKSSSNQRKGEFQRAGRTSLKKSSSNYMNLAFIWNLWIWALWGCGCFFERCLHSRRNPCVPQPSFPRPPSLTIQTNRGALRQIFQQSRSSTILWEVSLFIQFVQCNACSGCYNPTWISCLLLASLPGATSFFTPTVIILPWWFT